MARSLWFRVPLLTDSPEGCQAQYSGELKRSANRVSWLRSSKRKRAPCGGPAIRSAQLNSLPGSALVQVEQAGGTRARRTPEEETDAAADKPEDSDWGCERVEESAHRTAATTLGGGQMPP